jgi:hypothetical protein
VSTVSTPSSTPRVRLKHALGAPLEYPLSTVRVPCEYPTPVGVVRAQRLHVGRGAVLRQKGVHAHATLGNAYRYPCFPYRYLGNPYRYPYYPYRYLGNPYRYPCYSLSATAVPSWPYHPMSAATAAADNRPMQWRVQAIRARVGNKTIANGNKEECARGAILHLYLYLSLKTATNVCVHIETFSPVI